MADFEKELLTLVVSENSVAKTFKCDWKLRPQTPESEKRHSRCVDIVLEPTTSRDLLPPGASHGIYVSKNDGVGIEKIQSDSLVFAFLVDCLKLMSTQPNEAETNGTTQIGVKVILPDNNGYIVRSDFLERRLDGYILASKVVGFVSPRQSIQAIANPTKTNTLPTLLSFAIGGILLRTGFDANGDLLDRPVQEYLDILESELDNRLSFPWLSPTEIPHKRVVWVEGRKSVEVSRRMFEAARALGIALVVIDNPGHWLKDDNGPYAYLREAFIPVSISVNEGFVDRIVDAVRRYSAEKPVDGIITVSDARVVGVAEACTILGFTTSPVEAYIIAADKYKTRSLESANSHDEILRVFGVSDVQKRLKSDSLPPLSYPLIVKPCLGWGSECVAKVSNEEELLNAVERASSRHATSPQQRTDALIEPYIDGPEVDANFVLLNGAVVFYEIADDFPSRGDADDASIDDNFQETTHLFPSGLPENEVLAIRDSIHQSLLRQGFLTGTFHCEARLRYSSVYYTTKDGTLDLQPKENTAPTHEVQVYLLEVNARPPGYLASVPIHLTYGVDYYALQLLFSIGDEDRFAALANPYLKGPQYSLVMLMILEECAGIMKTPDAGRELLERVEELRNHVPDYVTVIKKGDRLHGPKSSELSYLAHFSVFSRKGRKDALRLAGLIRSEFRYELE